MLSAGPARCTGGGAEDKTSLQASPFPGLLYPLLGKETVSGGCRGHPSPALPRHRALQLFPSCPAPPQRQLGERLGAESGAQLLGSGLGLGRAAT